MITVQDVELRAGARLLLSDVTFRVQPGDRIGLVGRNGAGKTTLTKTLAKQTLPAAGSITHSAPVGYLPQDPRTGDLDVLARDRVLSARGLDEVMRSLEKAQVEMAERPDDAALLERYGRLEERFTAPRRVRRRGRGRPHLLEPGPARAGAGPAARHPVRRSAAAHRAGPHPVQRRDDAAARRADQPPRRRLHHLAARLPAEAQRRPHRHQPRRRAARRRGQQGLPPRRQPGRARPVQRRLEDLPAAARDRREAPQARAPQRREAGRRAQRAGREDARQGHQGQGRAGHVQARREAARRRRGGAGAGPRRQAALPGARAVRQDAADRQRAVEVVRLAGDLHRRRPGDRPRSAASSCSA